MIDVIILTNTADDNFYQICCDTISTLKSSNKKIKFNIIVIETNNKSNYVFDCDHYIIMNEEFNYNKFLNVGLRYACNDFYLILNNDLIFHDKSIENMLKIFDNYSDVMSISPLEPKYHKQFNFPSEGLVEGYNVPREIIGWCIFMRKNVINIIGQFDEQFKFWYQDNDYSNLLQKNKLKHVLSLDSHVTHLWSKSHDLLGDKIHEMTHKQQEKFINKWRNNF